MKPTPITVVLAASAMVAAAAFWPKVAAQTQLQPGGSEYLTIRWDGRENTHVIRPGGQVEFIGAQLSRLVRPARCNERSFYLNAAMNGLVKEGWEVSAMTPDDIVMRRPLGR